MKVVFAVLILAASMAPAADSALLREVDVDIKRPDPENHRTFLEWKAKSDPASADDQRFLKRAEQQLYTDVLMEVANGHWHDTSIARGEDWRVVQQSRFDQLKAEVPGENRDAFSRALNVIVSRMGSGVAFVPERVLSARFGDDAVWVFLLHCEIAEAVEEGLKKRDRSSLSHFAIIAVRCSDFEIVADTQCG